MLPYSRYTLARVKHSRHILNEPVLGATFSFSIREKSVSYKCQFIVTGGSPKTRECFSKILNPRFAE